MYYWRLSEGSNMNFTAGNYVLQDASPDDGPLVTCSCLVNLNHFVPQPLTCVEDSSAWNLCI